MSGPRYSIIPGDAVLDRRITEIHLRVLCVLGRHTDANGWCQVNQGRVGEQLGYSRQHVNRALKELVEFEYVEKVDGERDNGGRTVSKYRVLMDRDERSSANDGDENLSPVGDTPVTSEGDKPLSPLKVTTIERPIKGTTNRKPTNEKLVDNLFGQFWKAYPRRKSKDGARRKFQALLKRGIDPNVIVTGARRYAMLCASLGTELQFMKHPTTWLNNGCWEDDDLPALPDASGPRDHSPDKWRRMIDLVISGEYPWEESSMGPPPGHPECVCPKELITPQLIERCKPEGALI